MVADAIGPWPRESPIVHPSPKLQPGSPAPLRNNRTDRHRRASGGAGSRPSGNNRPRRRLLVSSPGHNVVWRHGGHLEPGTCSPVSATPSGVFWHFWLFWLVCPQALASGSILRVGIPAVPSRGHWAERGEIRDSRMVNCREVQPRRLTDPRTAPVLSSAESPARTLAPRSPPASPPSTRESSRRTV